jgi:hypothetical protein
VTFGGRDLDTIFVTTRGPDGGSVYAVKAPEGIAGCPEVAFGDVSQIVPSAGDAGGAGMGAVASVMAGLGVGAAAGKGKFCAACGAKHAAPGKFCVECGAPRA